MSAIAAVLLAPATLTSLIEGSMQAIQFLNSQIALYQQGSAVTEAQLASSAAAVAANTKATTAILNQAMAAMTPITQVETSAADKVPLAVAAPVVAVAGSASPETANPGIFPGA